MKLVKFVGLNLYGYLNVSVNFNDNLTFLTGINGSGKTSVVRGISSLISPSLLALAHTIHDRMELTIENENKTISIWSRRDDSHLYLGSSEVKEELKIILYPEEGFARPDSKSMIIQYYQENETRHADTEIMQLIRSLPTPMVLGIDRRSRELFEDERVVSRPRTFRRRDNIFRTSLSESLEEAIYLAVRQYRSVGSQKLDLANELRDQIVQNALVYKDVDTYKDEMDLLRLDLTYVEQMKIKASNILTEIGLQEEFVTTQLDIFFNKLTKLRERIPDKIRLEGVKPDIDPEIMSAFVEFMINRPQFDRIVHILVLIDDHVKKSQVIYDPIERYLSAINTFLEDANKRLVFRNTGELSVQIKNKSLEPITSLSSGECQLVVILTHLAFNPHARRANVFIIDEPELSLHVKWQEEFVTAIQQANPELQLILATHSPSIIIDRQQFCVDLSENIK